MGLTALVIAYCVASAFLICFSFWIEHRKEKRILAVIEKSEERVAARVIKILQEEEITVRVKTIEESPVEVTEEPAEVQL
jgi:hypothetical protein